MDGRTIGKILSKRIGKYFKGVFSFDEWRSLPLSKQPVAYVFNTEPRHIEFGHWIGIYVDGKGNATFFDSFGRSPESLGFAQFLVKHSKTWKYNNLFIQNPLTAVCGQHVIFFLIKAHANEKTTWISNFSSDLLNNDNLVHKMIEKTFKVHVPFFPNIEFMM